MQAEETHGTTDYGRYTMAKKIKIIHINDGTGKERENGGFHFVEDFPWTEKYLQRYLREGYEIKCMVPEVSPAIQGEGRYSFYKSGFTFLLEKEVPDGEEDAEEEEDSPKAEDVTENMEFEADFDFDFDPEELLDED